MASFQITRRNGDVYTVLIDDKDYDRVMAAGPWHVAIRQHGTYVARKVKNRTELLHRWLLSPEQGRDVDHVNQVGLDNRRENLRVCSRNQNLGNTRRPRNNTSGFKGVTWHKQRGRWMAQIQVARKCRNLGLFDTPEEAHAAYQEAAAKVFGEFARFA